MEPVYFVFAIPTITIIMVAVIVIGFQLTKVLKLLEEIKELLKKL